METGAYQTEVQVSTTAAVASLRNLKAEVTQMTSAFAALNAVVKEGEADFKSMVSSVTSLMAAQRQAAAVEKDLAANAINTAKVEAIRQAQLDKSAEAYLKQEAALSNAIVAEQRAADVSAKSAASQDAAEQAMWNKRQKVMQDWTSLQSQGILNEQKAAASVEADAARQADAEQKLFLSRQKAMQDWAAQQSQGIAAEERAAEAAYKLSLSTKGASDSQKDFTDNLSNTRYLLYDVGAAYTTMSAALEAIPVATVAVAAAYQRDFAQVQRITGDTSAQSDQLKQGLMDLTTQLPVSFDQVTQIAQLGAHLQLGNEGLVQFTATVSKFAAATGVSVDTASQLFSRMKTSMKDSAEAGDGYFNQLGSSIAEMGTKVVATDSEISSMVTQISAVTASAGMGTEATVGLAGAMASLRIQPEMARGALTRLFANFNRDSADSTQKMAEFGKVMGMTGQQASALWQSNPTQFFDSLIKGLNGAYQHGQNLTVLFDQMGIKNVRDVNTLQRLAEGYTVLQNAMKGAADGYQNGTALDTLTKPVFETLLAKLTEFKNTLGEIATDLGAGVLPYITGFVEGLTNVVKGFDSLINTVPGLKTVVDLLLGFSMVAGVFTAFRAVQAFVLAGLISFQETLSTGAQRVLNTSGIVKQFAATMLMAKGASDEMAQAMVRNSSAVSALGTAATTSKTKIEAMKTVSSEASAAVGESGLVAEAAATRFGAFGNTLMSIGKVAIPMIGVALLTDVIGQMGAAQQATDDVGKAMSDAFGSGGTQALIKNTTEKLAELKMTVGTSGLDGLFNGGTSVSDIVNQFNVPFDKLVAATAKGKAGIAEIGQIIDQVAQSKGFKNLDDMLNSDWNVGDSGKLDFLKNSAINSANAFDKQKASADTTKQAISALGGATEDTASQIDAGTSATDKLDASLKKLNGTIFGTVDDANAVGKALDQLGQSMHKGGSFGNDSIGQANLKNFEDALAAAQQYYGDFYKKTGDATAAAQQYAQFVQALINSVQAKGGDLGSIKDLANQTIQAFQDTLNGGGGARAGAAGGSGSSGGATIPVKVDPVQVNNQARYAVGQVGAVVENAAQHMPSVPVGVNSQPAQASVEKLAGALSTLTGQPYRVVMDALTKPGSDKANEFQNIITQIVNNKYQAKMGVDAGPAEQTVKDFLQYVLNATNSAQSLVNRVASSSANPVLANHLVSGVQPTTSARADAPTPIKPNVIELGPVTSAASDAANNATAANNDLLNSLGNLDNGYNDVKNAAKGAGDAAKKAAKDAADGISEAAAAANDYASRLKTGLTNAYDQQYGLSAATDAYHLQLNKIIEDRQKEIDQVQTLTDKLKQLQDAQSKDRIDAGKAQTEAAISSKYGETARAVDYQNQAQTALDNAAAKQKDIDATKAQLKTTQDGIGALTGYSDAAINNRKAVEDLEQKMLDMVVAYAKTGATSEQVRDYAQKLGVQFQQQAGDAFQNKDAVDNLTGDMGRYIGVVNSVPYIKPTTVTANTQPAIDAINGFKNWANAQSATVQVNDTFKYVLVDNGIDGATGQQVYAVDKQVGYNSDGSAIYDGTGVKVFNEGGLIPGQSPSDPGIDNLLAQVDGKGLVKVRSGEFIMQQPAVDYWGRDFMDAINSMRMPQFNQGGAVGGRSSRGGDGFQVVALDSNTLSVLQRLLDRPVNLWTNDEIIARSNTRGQTLLAAKGVS